MPFFASGGVPDPLKLNKIIVTILIATTLIVGSIALTDKDGVLFINASTVINGSLEVDEINTTQIYVDHIAERTNSHSVVIDDTLKADIITSATTDLINILIEIRMNNQDIFDIKNMVSKKVISGNGTIQSDLEVKESIDVGSTQAVMLARGKNSVIRGQKSGMGTGAITPYPSGNASLIGGASTSGQTAGIVGNAIVRGGPGSSGSGFPSKGGKVIIEGGHSGSANPTFPKAKGGDVDIIGGAESISGTGSPGYGDINLLSDTFAFDNLNVMGNITANQIYGEMFNHTDAGNTIIISDSTTYFDITNLEEGFLNGFTVNNNTLIPQIAGIYKLNWAMAFGNVGNNVEYQMTIKVNEEIKNECEAHRKVGASGDVGSASGTCFLSLSVNDEVRLGIKNIDGTQNAIIFNVNVNALRIGD